MRGGGEASKTAESPLGKWSPISSPINTITSYPTTPYNAARYLAPLAISLPSVALPLRILTLNAVANILVGLCLNVPQASLRQMWVCAITCVRERSRASVAKKTTRTSSSPAKKVASAKHVQSPRKPAKRAKAIKAASTKPESSRVAKPVRPRERHRHGKARKRQPPSPKTSPSSFPSLVVRTRRDSG